MKLATRIWTLRISGAIPLLPHMLSWHGKGKTLYCVFHIRCAIHHHVIIQVILSKKYGTDMSPIINFYVCMGLLTFWQ